MWSMADRSWIRIPPYIGRSLAANETFIISSHISVFIGSFPGRIYKQLFGFIDGLLRECGVGSK